MYLQKATKYGQKKCANGTKIIRTSKLYRSSSCIVECTRPVASYPFNHDDMGVNIKRLFQIVYERRVALG